LTCKAQDATLYLGMTTESNTEVIWHRCSKVWIENDTIHWQLDESGPYDLIRAYRQGRPHRDLITATTDDRLRAFVRRWGPLMSEANIGAHPVQCDRDVRDILTAVVRLIGAIGDRTLLRSRLLDLIRLRELRLNQIQTFLDCTPRWHEVCSNPEQWCESASSTEVESLCEQFVNELYLGGTPRLIVVKRKRRPVVRASLRISTLFDAIWWMVYEDILREEPFSFCRECGELIQREGRREWKFCPGPCGKRHADRASWRRQHGKNLRYRKGE
jgi:hypothetical protein